MKGILISDKTGSLARRSPPGQAGRCGCRARAWSRAVGSWCVCSAHTSSFPSWKHVSGSHLTLSPPDRESYYLMPESLPTMGKVAFLPPSPALQIWLTPISIIPPNRFACCCFLLTTVIVAPTLS